MTLTQDLPAAQHSPATLAVTESIALDLASTLTVNRNQLLQAYTKARFAERRLSNIDNLCELDMEAIDDLCRSLFQATQILNEMLNR